MAIYLKASYIKVGFMFLAGMKNSFFALISLIMFFSFTARGQINQPLPPNVPDAALLEDIFRTTKELQQRCRAIEFKQRITFRLAGIVRDEQNRRNVNLDFRQSADYFVTVKPGQTAERKILQSQSSGKRDLDSLLRKFDILALQETLPSIATLETALLSFIRSEYVNSYRELKREKIKKHAAIKLLIRFRPGYMFAQECYLWIDEKTHIPLRAELIVGDVGRYGNVVLLTEYEGLTPETLPLTIYQEISCNTFEVGIPLRVEHFSLYSEIRPLTTE